MKYIDEIEYSEKTDHTIYLDIDNDGIIEKTKYINEDNKLIITKNDEFLSEMNLVDYGVSFNGIGMHGSLYYFEYVSDYNANIYLHIYTSYLIGDDPDGNRISGGTDSYYKLIDNEWNESDYIHYKYSWDRQSPHSDIIYMEVNGQETDSADYIIEKYSPIENTYYEIPY